MAPISNSPKAVQHTRSRPSVTKAIVPAIPLPYIQKRNQQVAARQNAKEDAQPAPVTEPQTSQAPPPAAAEPAVANGSSTEYGDIEAQESSKKAGSGSTEQVLPVVCSNGDGEHEPAKQESAAEAHTDIAGTLYPHNSQSIYGLICSAADKALNTHVSAPSFHMPPAFVPANQAQSNTAAFNPVKLPPQQIFNNGHSLHQAQPSAGSVMFGGYPDSDNSSPAPPLSAGNLPPYPFQQQSRHGPHHSNGNHSQQMSNGFSAMGPPPQGYYPRQESFNNQASVTENPARRQLSTFGPVDGNSPSATPSGFESPRFPPYDPSTPHSFQGSQSSAPNEQDSNGPTFYGQYPTAVISNGSNGHIDEVRLYQQPRMKPRSGTPGLAPHPVSYPMGPPPPPADNFDGLVSYLASQFADAELADYVLELRYSDDRAPPVRIPGHNIMFARSPCLKALMRTQSQEGSGLPVKPLFIESDDRFLRSDGFWMAVQRLYGGPLLDLGTAALHYLPQTVRHTAPMPGTAADRFELALGYAAAGHILQIPPVTTRGIELACMTVGWETIEKALDFAIDGGLDAQWTYSTRPRQLSCPSTYGPAANMLVYAALNFIITAFPPSFDLDTSVGAPAYNHRLPLVSHERSPAQNPRLSFIKFGDHPSEDSIKSEPTSIIVTLSKVLLNLPFHLLKYVLESPRLGNVEGWASETLRQKAMHTIIEEREKRRLKALATPYTHPKTDDQYDDTTRWREAVDPHGGPEGAPALVRSWFETGHPSSDN
jgi:hypothetical protein